MILDLQKANMWKRISAYLFDMILLGIAAVGFTFLLSSILGYDSYTERLDAAYEKYEAEKHVFRFLRYDLRHYGGNRFCRQPDHPVCIFRDAYAGHDSAGFLLSES